MPDGSNSVDFRKGFMGCLGVAAAIGVLITAGSMLSKCSPEATSAESGPPAVTLAEFNQLQPGMSYDQAAKILGSPGVVLSQTTLEGFGTTTMYQWTAGDVSNMNATFENGRLTSKAQLGLQ